MVLSARLCVLVGLGGGGGQAAGGAPGSACRGGAGGPTSGSVGLDHRAESLSKTASDCTSGDRARSPVGSSSACRDTLDRSLVGGL